MQSSVRPFLSTLSLRRATSICQAPILPCNAFLSTLSLRRATQTFACWYIKEMNFYPRSPCGERPNAATTANEALQFLSTLSLRRATRASQSYSLAIMHFYPRSPCGERHGALKHVHQTVEISIHALLAESDPHAAVLCRGPRHISIHALLAESDRCAILGVRRTVPISIHALLAESDISCAWSASKFGDFYPRSPCGERLPSVLHNFRPLQISIHALLAESDAGAYVRF